MYFFPKHVCTDSLLKTLEWRIRIVTRTKCSHFDVFNLGAAVLLGV
jgi:hypothetical protein